MYFTITYTQVCRLSAPIIYLAYAFRITKLSFNTYLGSPGSTGIALISATKKDVNRALGRLISFFWRPPVVTLFLKRRRLRCLFKKKMAGTGGPCTN